LIDALKGVFLLMEETREQETVDNSVEAPSNEGQAEDTARSKEDAISDLGKLGFSEEEEVEEQQDNINQDFQQEEETSEQSEVHEVGDKQYNSVEEMKEDLQDFYQNEQKYQELRKKLSERDDKAKRAEQYDQFFQQNQDVLKLVDQYSQDEDLQTLVQAYERNLINGDQLQQAKQYLQKENHSKDPQNTSQQQQFNQQNNQQNQMTQQLQQELNQLKQSQQQMVMNEAYQSVETEYNELQENYGELLQEEGINVENLTQIAGQHSFFKQGQLAPQLPDLKQAFNYYVANNPDTFKTLQKVVQNDQQHKQQQVKNAQVEKNSPRQEISDEEDTIVDDITRYGNFSGGGVL